MKSEWRHALTISVKIMVRGNCSHDYSVKDWTDWFGNLWYWEKIIIDYCIHKISKDNFEFSNNRNICERTIVDEYEYKILSRYVEKQLSFTVMNALKGHFCVMY